MSGKDKAIEWVQSLKDGDPVILIAHGVVGNCAKSILHVSKVTPSGIVRTKEGASFRQSKWTDGFYVVGYGDTRGYIEPYSELLADKARQNMEREREERVRRVARGRLRTLCYEFYLSVVNKLSDEQVKEITAILEEAKAGERDV